MKAPRIILADDHRIFLEGLSSLLTPQFQVVACVEDGRALLEAVNVHRPDAVVADISMPLLNGIEATRRIKETHKQIRVLILTMHSDLDFALEAVQAGASGYLLKHSAFAEITQALNTVLRGRMYITPRLKQKLDEVVADLNSGRRRKLPELTERQRDVLHLIAEGKTASEVAEMLHISPRTVNFHKYAMLRQLGLDTTASLIRYAIRERLI